MLATKASASAFSLPGKVLGAQTVSASSASPTEALSLPGKPFTETPVPLVQVLDALCSFVDQQVKAGVAGGGAKNSVSAASATGAADEEEQENGEDVAARAESSYVRIDACLIPGPDVDFTGLPP